MGSPIHRVIDDPLIFLGLGSVALPLSHMLAEPEGCSIEVSATVQNDETEIQIADNGPGIPEGQKAEVFGRGEKGLERSGTGVGLSLFDTLVEEYDGRVRVEDTSPAGSVFHVVLQAEQAECLGA